MGKRILSDVLILFGLLALWASTSRTAMGYISQKRDVDKWWGAYQCNNGDLVSLAGLDIIKKFNPGREPRTLKRSACVGAGNTDLYMVGDSYSWHLYDSNFAALHYFCYINRSHGCNYHLDSTRRNIMVIEISERGIGYFKTLDMLNEVCDSVVKKKNITLGSSRSFGQYASIIAPISVDDFFNKYINQNLQYNLFNYQFLTPLFSSKAALNFYVFNRASGDVVISENKDFLFLRQTVSLTDMGSSYYPVAPDIVDTIVANINTIYDYYRRNGFSEVYFSIIPNSATIVQPDGYNNVIPRIQNDPRLRTKIIDVYSVFKNSQEVLYRRGDTHWNNKGKQIWVDMINAILVSENGRSS